MSSNSHLCIWICFILSCSAILILPIWGGMLLHHSRLFELPNSKKTRAGWACFTAALLYAITGICCVIALIRERKESFKFRTGRNSYTTANRQVEMKPLLDDNSDHSDIPMSEGHNFFQPSRGSHTTLQMEERRTATEHFGSNRSSPSSSRKGDAAANTSYMSQHNAEFHQPSISSHCSTTSSIYSSDSGHSIEGKSLRLNVRRDERKGSPSRWSNARASRRIIYEELPS